MLMLRNHRNELLITWALVSIPPSAVIGFVLWWLMNVVTPGTPKELAWFIGALVYSISVGTAGGTIFATVPPVEPEKPHEPPKVDESLHIRLWAWDTEYSSIISTFPQDVSLAQIHDFFYGLYADDNWTTPLTYAEWWKERRVFTETQFRSVCDVLQRRGLINWKDPSRHNRGMELTQFGKRVIRTYVLTTQPLPQIEMSGMPNVGIR